MSHNPMTYQAKLATARPYSQFGLYSLILSSTVIMKKVNICDITTLFYVFGDEQTSKSHTEMLQTGPRPGIGSTSHCLSNFENTKSCLKLFFHSPENIAIAYLQKTHQ